MTKRDEKFAFCPVFFKKCYIVEFLSQKIWSVTHICLSLQSKDRVFKTINVGIAR